MKAFDLEKLQSFTLSGEKINKEIFDALFINPSPYHHYHTQNGSSGYYTYNYNAFNHQPSSSPESTAAVGSPPFYSPPPPSHHQHHHHELPLQTKLDIEANHVHNNNNNNSSFNVRNYEIFKGAFETAANNCGKTAINPEVISSEYPFYENRFYQPQTFNY